MGPSTQTLASQQASREDCEKRSVIVGRRAPMFWREKSFHLKRVPSKYPALVRQHPMHDCIFEGLCINISIVPSVSDDTVRRLHNSETWETLDRCYVPHLFQSL